MIYYLLKNYSEVKRMNNKKQNSFTVFFSRFPALLLAGVIFSAFFAAFMTLSISAAKLSGFDNILVWGLGIIPSSVFLPGLVMVVRKYSVEKNFVPVISTFFKAVRENFKDFIFHGFVIYLIFASSFFAILYYFTQAQTDIVFAYILVIYILFTAIMILMLFYLPLMAVTYELRYRDLYGRRTCGRLGFSACFHRRRGKNSGDNFNYCIIASAYNIFNCFNDFKGNAGKYGFVCK